MRENKKKFNFFLPKAAFWTKSPALNKIFSSAWNILFSNFSFTFIIFKKICGFGFGFGFVFSHQYHHPPEKEITHRSVTFSYMYLERYCYGFTYTHRQTNILGHATTLLIFPLHYSAVIIGYLSLLILFLYQCFGKYCCFVSVISWFLDTSCEYSV